MKGKNSRSLNRVTGLDSFVPAASGNAVDTGLLLEALTALKDGDFSVRLPVTWIGIPGRVADAFNEAVQCNQRLAKELERASRVVGKEGKIDHRISIGHTAGDWAAAVSSINTLIGDLVCPIREMARVIGAVANG